MQRRFALAIALVAATWIACGGSSPHQKVVEQPVVEPAPSPGTPLGTDPAVRIGELENGLTYYIRKHQKPEKRTLLWLAVDAGSVLEDDDQQGLAHFVEHMAFNGTKRFAKHELINFMESIGMKFGPEVNAHTGFDETVYKLILPTDDPATVDKGFEILEDWAHAISFDPEEVEKERGVVLEEWRLGRGAQKRILDKQFPIVFKGSKYAERLPIGKSEIIERAPVEALTRFYRDWYRPDLMAVIVVGDIDPDAMEAKVKKHFAGLRNPDNARARVTASIPPHSETLVTVVTDAEMPMTAIQVFNKLPRQPQRTDLDYRRRVVENLFQVMFNARLTEITKKPNPPFLFAMAQKAAFVRPIDISLEVAVVKQDGVKRGLEALVTELERVDRHGFTSGELEREKASTLRAYEQTLAERDKSSARVYASEILRNFMAGELMPGIEAELALLKRFLPEITLEELNALAKDWVREENRVIAVVGPDGAPIPPEADLLAIVRTVDSLEVTPYEDQTSSEPLLAEKPEAGTVAKRTAIAELGVTEWTLSNGVRVVVKPTDFKNDEVRFLGFSPGGHSLVADADYPSALYAAGIVGGGGVGEFSDTVLRKMMAGKVVSVTPFIRELEEGLQGRASPQDLETLFQLIHLSFVAPRPDPEAFAAWKARQEEQIKNRDLSPEQSFFEEYMAFIGSNHMRAKPATLELLAQVSLDKAMAVYRDRFADAGDFTFVFVGNLDLATLEPLVATYLGSLPNTGRKESWKDVGIKPPKGVKTMQVKKGKEPKSFTAMTFHGNRKWSAEDQDDIEILRDLVRIRLREVLREEMGGTYGVYVRAEHTRRPKQRYVYALIYGSSPDNVDKMKKAVLDIVASVKKTALGAEYLEKVKQARLRKRETDLKENGFWLNELATHYRFGTDATEILDQDKLVERITAKHVKRAARTFLNIKSYAFGVLYPEK